MKGRHVSFANTRPDRRVTPNYRPKNQTARAAAGTGVLFYDPDGTGELTEKRQCVFTEWDPTATSDIEALRAVFDSNGDGVFDASDAKTIHARVSKL